MAPYSINTNTKTWSQRVYDQLPNSLHQLEMTERIFVLTVGIVLSFVRY